MSGSAHICATLATWDYTTTHWWYGSRGERSRAPPLTSPIRVRGGVSPLPS